MKLLFDFFPILLFFVAFKVKGIYIATAVAIAAAVGQVIWVLARRKKPEPTLWINLAVLTVFGGFTIALHNELFIKWKPTILYGLFAAILAGGRMFFGKNLIQSLLAKQLALPGQVWERLNAGWIAFFCVVGALNLFVAYRYPTPVWVNFKLFGLLGCTVLFAVIQSIFLAPYISAAEKKQDTAG